VQPRSVKEEEKSGGGRGDQDNVREMGMSDGNEVYVNRSSTGENNSL